MSEALELVVAGSGSGKQRDRLVSEITKQISKGS